jgi:hypothetical protein
MSAYTAMTSSHNLALAGANVAFTGFPFNGSFSATASPVPQGKMLRSVSAFPAGSTTYRDTVEIILANNSNNSFSLFA